MKDVLHFILTNIVDNPDDVAIESSEEDGFVQFTVSVHKDDMGKVIGKDGKVIRAVRNVMKIRALKEEKKVQILLAENQAETN